MGVRVGLAGRRSRPASFARCACGGGGNRLPQPARGYTNLKEAPDEGSAE